MQRPNFPRRIVAVAMVIVAGPGLGFGVSRLWRTDDSRPDREPAAPEASRPAGQSQAAESNPAAAGPAAGRRALLVGVTTYDHLPWAYHLKGPANDVRLMRRL